MEKKPFIAQTSLVPVLACIAALLFSANFYQFLQKNFKKWWGWDFTCPLEQVDCHRYEMHELQEHRRHRHQHRRHHQHRKHKRHYRHRHEVRDQQTIILDLQGEALNRDVEQNLQNAERRLQRNLERALRDLERLHERMEWDANAHTHADRERLETEIRIKAENLQALQRQLESHAAEIHQDGNTFIHEFRFDDNNIKIRIREH